MAGRAWAVIGVCGIATAAPCAAADPADGVHDALPSGRFAYPEPPATETSDLERSSHEKSAAQFGDAGSCWWAVGGNASWAPNGSTDTGPYFAFSYFMARDVEFAGEADLWYFNQPGDNAGGLSASMVFRWHFVNTGAWTVYIDAGIGVLGATDEVPDGGTSFDFMPRAGGGFTTRLTDDGMRLQVGLRWHHISNARIFGDSNNPGRDQPLVYVGLIFPF